MSKVKVKKQSTFIDMTAMSDVTVLLLTFFMLTSNFIKKEPVQVVTPSSVSEVKIPEYDIMTILIDTTGRVFLNLDLVNTKNKTKVLENVGALYGKTFTDKEKRSFTDQPSIGMPMSQLQGFLDRPSDEQDQLLKTGSGLPMDSVLEKNELANWVRAANDLYDAGKLSIAIKSDGGTPYPKVKAVLSTLQDLKLNRYNLITALKAMPAEVQ